LRRLPAFCAECGDYEPEPMQPELSTPKRVIQWDIADGTVDREVREEPAAEAVLACMDDSPETIARP
jgi:hypothetical protein